MCHHINPHSINSYLSGISQQLETHFPSIKEARNSILIHCTLQDCMRMRGTATVCKHALTINDLQLVVYPYFVQRDPSIGTGALRISLQWHYGFTHTLYRGSWTSAMFQLNGTYRPMPSKLGKYDK